MKQSVEKRGGVAVRKHKAVAVRPRRVCRTMAQIASPEYGGDFRQAHRCAGMAGFCRFHRVHRQRAQRGRDRLIEPLRDLGRQHIHYAGLHQMARRRFSTNWRIIGVRMSCMARSSLLPGITIEFARDIKLPCSIDTRYEKSMPRGLRKRITTIDSSGVGIQRATNGFDVSTVGTRWKLMSVWVNCGQMKC